MAQHKISEKLNNEIKTLSIDEQEHLLLYVKNKIKDEPLRQPIAKEFSFSIALPISPHFPESEHKKLSETAKYSAFYAEAIFWLLKEFNKSSWDTGEVGNRDEMFQNVYFISQIGIALLKNAADYIDRAELITVN